VLFIWGLVQVEKVLVAQYMLQLVVEGVDREVNWCCRAGFLLSPVVDESP